MGYIEDIEALELADDVKEKLLQSHRAEVDPLKQTNDQLSARNKKDTVSAEVAELSEMGFKEAPGLLKFYRRVLLSPDSEEPGTILLSDNELELSGDEATGANGREDISTAEVLRKFVSLMPKTNEGKLAITLSEQSNELENHNRPNSGEENDEEKAANRSEATNRLAGRKVERTRKRYNTVPGAAEGV